MEHTGGTLRRAAEKKRKHSGELEESTLLLNFIHFLVLVIYIFVTIQLFNVCLVLFLTLLYIRTQMISPKNNQYELYRYMTRFNLFHRRAFL